MTTCITFLRQEPRACLANPATMSRVEMHLVSSRDHTARIGSHTIVFTEGEARHMESSHKYRPESFEALVERGGWRVKTAWTSDAPSFGVFLLDTEGADAVVVHHITNENRF